MDSSQNTMEISGGNLKAQIIARGATLTGLYMDHHPRSLILQHETTDAYTSNEAYLGSIVGRFANRIKDASFTLEGKAHKLNENWLGRHCLHGGRFGIAHQNWRVENKTTNSVSLSVTDYEKTSGFPGDCEITAQYSILENSILQIHLTATSTETTPCSITAHPYFNLGLSNTVSDHILQIPANHYLPVDHEGIPTGELRDVENSPFDFNDPKCISEVEFDENFCLSNNRDTLKKVAEVLSPETGIRMEVWSNETGVQFYNGGGLKKPFGKYQGLCLEPQAWPDAPNQKPFPKCVIDAGVKYEHTIQYKFSTA